MADLNSSHIDQPGPAVVEVALVPVQGGSKLDSTGVVEVALVPVARREAFGLLRMAKAILSADLSNVKDVA